MEPAAVAKISSLCNDAHLVFERRTETGQTNVFSITGEATEAALKVLAEKLGVPERRLNDDTWSVDDHALRVRAASLRD